MYKLLFLLSFLALASCSDSTFRAKLISDGSILTITDEYRTNCNLGDTVYIYNTGTNNDWFIKNGPIGSDTCIIKSLEGAYGIAKYNICYRQATIIKKL